MIEDQVNKEKILKEIRQTFRLLPSDRRTTLMDFILEEREHGSSYITNKMMSQLTSGIILHGGLTDKKNIFFDMNLVVYDDLRELTTADDNYPLYLDCYNGKAKEVINKIQNYAEVLCLLEETEISALAQEIYTPDTEKEIAQKVTRHEETKKIALQLHNERYKKDKYYRAIIGDVETSSSWKRNIRTAATLAGLCAIGAIIYALAQNKNGRAYEQPTPQIQKVTDQKHLYIQDISRGARTE